MQLKGSHTIVASSLRGLLDQLNELPDSLLDNGIVTDAYVNKVEERTYHKDYTVSNWYLTLDTEWAVVS